MKKRVEGKMRDLLLPLPSPVLLVAARMEPSEPAEHDEAAEYGANEEGDEAGWSGM